MWETPSYTLLHLPSSLRKNVEVTVPSALPMDVPEDANPLSSTCITSSLTESSEILLQIIPLKILGNNGKSITTYGLIDSGFDVTMIEPSLVDQHEIPGATGTTVPSHSESKRPAGTGSQRSPLLVTRNAQKLPYVMLGPLWIS